MGESFRRHSELSVPGHSPHIFRHFLEREQTQRETLPTHNGRGLQDLETQRAALEGEISAARNTLELLQTRAEEEGGRRSSRSRGGRAGSRGRGSMARSR